MDRLRRLADPAARSARGRAARLQLGEPRPTASATCCGCCSSRLTLNEIASELSISANTLKFHLRVIYRKLGVNGRERAVEVARALARSATRA